MITCKLFATLIYGARDIEDKMKCKITQTGMVMIVISTKIKQGHQIYLDLPPRFVKFPTNYLRHILELNQSSKYTAHLSYIDICVSMTCIWLLQTDQPTPACLRYTFI